MINNWKKQINYIYNTKQIANTLKISRSTVNKYARSLEKFGYEFKKNINNWRIFSKYDLIVFYSLIELLSQGIYYNNAIILTIKKYKINLNINYSSINFTINNNKLLEIEAKLNFIILTIQSLSVHINENIKKEILPTLNKINNHPITTKKNQTKTELINKNINKSLSRSKKYKKYNLWSKLW